MEPWVLAVVKEGKEQQLLLVAGAVVAVGVAVVPKAAVAVAL